MMAWTRIPPTTYSFAATAVLLILGLCPLPDGWLRGARDSARSPELNRADREASAGGYYEGLISGGSGPEGARGEFALRLLGKPTEWTRFHDAGVAQPLPDDFIQFELLPDQDVALFGQPFTTNAFAMRDREYTEEKPADTFRIALLGSSMDMGWGVGTEETYENRLEDWLNAHAELRGLKRRFEVLNFAVAAYGPVQRLELFRRKVASFNPDLVIYSATMLDIRLLEIHLCGLLQNRLDLQYDFLRRAVADARLTPDDLRLDDEGSLVGKETIKAKLRPFYWVITESTLALLAEDCRENGLPLLCAIIPRVGKADAPESRLDTVSIYRRIAVRHGFRLLDLSGTFDGRDPAKIEIAAWDDHPNALGHKLLFRAMARGLVEDPKLYRLLFGVDLAVPLRD